MVEIRSSALKNESTQIFKQCNSTALHYERIGLSQPIQPLYNLVRCINVDAMAASSSSVLDGKKISLTTPSATSLILMASFFEYADGRMRTQLLRQTTSVFGPKA